MNTLTIRRLAAGAVLSLSLATFPAISPSLAQEDLSQQQIIDKLKKKPLTRSIKGDGSISKADEMELREVLSRSIGVRERKKIAEITKEAKLPALDFSISFAFDSAEIEPDSYELLDALAAAMQSPDLGNANFLVNGHTDAKGADDYNQDLSERRAEAVASYLAERHAVDYRRMKPIGHGESQLKDEYDGNSGVNRRVEIVNLPWEN